MTRRSVVLRPSGDVKKRKAANCSTTGGTSSMLPTVKASDLTFCVDETNRYPALRNRSPRTRSASIEQFAAVKPALVRLLGLADRFGAGDVSVPTSG